MRLQPVKELNSSTKVWDAGHRSAPDGLSHAAAVPLRHAKLLPPPLLLRFPYLPALIPVEWGRRVSAVSSIRPPFALQAPLIPNLISEPVFIFLPAPK